MYFACPRYVFACMSKMRARKAYSCLSVGSGVFYIHEALASPAGETGANGLKSLVFRNADSLSSLTGELNSPLIILC